MSLYPSLCPSVRLYCGLSVYFSFCPSPCLCLPVRLPLPVCLQECVEKSKNPVFKIREFIKWLNSVIEKFRMRTNTYPMGWGRGRGEAPDHASPHFKVAHTCAAFILSGVKTAPSPSRTPSLASCHIVTQVTQSVQRRYRISLIKSKICDRVSCSGLYNCSSKLVSVAVRVN